MVAGKDVRSEYFCASNHQPATQEAKREDIPREGIAHATGTARPSRRKYLREHAIQHVIFVVTQHCRKMPLGEPKVHQLDCMIFPRNIHNYILSMKVPVSNKTLVQMRHSRKYSIKNSPTRRHRTTAREWHNASKSLSNTKLHDQRTTSTRRMFWLEYIHGAHYVWMLQTSQHFILKSQDCDKGTLISALICALHN
jgi:hypothetical protein